MKSKSIRNNEKSQIELWKIAVQYVHNLPAYLLILVTLGYVLISSSVNCSSTSGEALFFKLQPVDSLLSSCSVCVEITLVNTSGSTIVLYHWKHRQSGLKGAIGYYLNFHITNNNQDTASESVIILRPKLPHRSDTLQLKPGEEYKQIINLTPYYSIIGDTIISDSSYSTREKAWYNVDNRCWPIGVYEIQATYEYKHKASMIGGKDLWQGKATSNTITIELEQ